MRKENSKNILSELTPPLVLVIKIKLDLLIHFLDTRQQPRNILENLTIGLSGYFLF